jgi:hypothetical protein
MKRSTQHNWRNLQLVEGGLLYCKCRRTEVGNFEQVHLPSADEYYKQQLQKMFPIINEL